MERSPCAYILSNGFKRLYIGVTSQLQTRIWKHKHPEPGTLSHAARYNINQLVYREYFTDMAAAIAREKELKGWTRPRKLALIIANNPTWQDLSKEWGKPIELFDEAKHKKKNDRK